MLSQGHAWLLRQGHLGTREKGEISLLTLLNRLGLARDIEHEFL